MGKKRIATLMIAGAVLLCSALAVAVLPQETAFADGDGCTTILFKGQSCEDMGETTLTDLVMVFVNILKVGISVLGVIGVLICGFLYLTARDNEAQVTKAKKRLIEVIIGLIAWVLFWVCIDFFVPTSGEAIRGAGIQEILVERMIA